jgi:hypothetical protein
MYLIMLLDTMGKRYKMLPSQALSQANTLDLYIMEQALAYHNMEKDANGRAIKPPPKLTQDQMIAMLNRVKEESNGQ